MGTFGKFFDVEEVDVDRLSAAESRTTASPDPSSSTDCNTTAPQEPGLMQTPDWARLPYLEEAVNLLSPGKAPKKC